MKLFVILCCLLGKAAADSGNDFVNNLFTDLAPLLALFGERVTQQFMSQSTGWADHILLSMAREIDDKLDAILPLRRDLAEASDWNGPLSSLAIKLAESMDAVMDLCFSSSSFCNDAQWDILLSPQKHRGARYARFHIRRENGRWQNQSDEIDAALSLWIFSNNRLAVAKQLIEYGAALDRQDKTGNSPIFWAAYKGYNKMFRFLFPQANIQRLCNGGRTLLHAAVIGGSRVIVRMISEDGRALINMTAVDEASMTALEYAVANEDVKMVRYLSTILGPMIRGSRAMHKVIMATIKCDRTIQIDRESGSDRLESKRVAVLRVLLSKHEVGSPQLVDLMIKAIRRDNDEAVLLLIREFKCHVDTQSSNGEYPIHIAVEQHSLKFLKILAEDGKASLGKKDENGKTVFEYAVALDLEDIVGYLCRIEAEVPPDSLRLALFHRNYDIAQQLLELGVEIDDQCFKAIKNGGTEATVAKLTKVLKNFQERNNGADDKSGRKRRAL
ncbi:hypothetical protein MY4038_003972 [Beauveria bassiana]